MGNNSKATPNVKAWLVSVTLPSFTTLQIYIQPSAKAAALIKAAARVKTFATCLIVFLTNLITAQTNQLDDACHNRGCHRAIWLTVLALGYRPRRGNTLKH